MYQKVEKVIVKHTASGYTINIETDSGMTLKVGKVPMPKREMQALIKSLSNAAPDAKVIIDK